MTKIFDDIALEIITDLVGIPVGSGEQALDAIWGCVTDMFGDLPSILALDGADEGAEIVVGLLARFSADKMVRNPLMESRETDSPSANLGGIEIVLNQGGAPPFFTAWLLFYQVRL
jgi:hypothetical protein